MTEETDGFLTAGLSKSGEDLPRKMPDWTQKLSPWTALDSGE